MTIIDSSTKTLTDVRKEVDVPLNVDDAFDLFVNDPLGWWPPRHCFVTDRIELVIEPKVGGRYYEVGADGRVVDWGKILVCRRGEEVLMTWRMGANWQPVTTDEDASLIRVEFTATGPETTQVALTHADLHRHKDAAATIHAALSGPSPGETLERFAALADRRVAEVKVGV